MDVQSLGADMNCDNFILIVLVVWQYSYIGNDCDNAIESMPVPTFDDKTVWK